MVLAEHLSIPLGESVKLVNKISQNLHTEMLLRTAAQAERSLGYAGRSGEFPRRILCDCGNSAGRRGADGWFGIFAARSGNAARVGGAVAVRAEAAVVRGVLRFAAGGGDRWNAGRSHEEQYCGGTVAREDRFVEHVRTRSGYADTAQRAAAGIFLSEQQHGFERTMKLPTRWTR